MPEHDDLDQIEAAFTRFRSGGPLVAAAGPDAARAVFRRRRSTRAALGVVAAGLVLAAPVTAYATGVVGDDATPDPGISIPPTTVPPPTTAPPSSPPTASPSTSGAVPDGRISSAALGNAALDLPDWSSQMADRCPAGRVKFTGGEARKPGEDELSVRIANVIHVDVDRDGRKETVAKIGCSGVEMDETKVLAFDRDAAGDIVTMGQVVTNDGDIAVIGSIRGARTAVEVQVYDRGFEGVPSQVPQKQWRAYSWNGSGFAQSGGPTAFPPNPYVTDLSVTGGNLTMRPAGDNRLTGSLTLTVRNAGPVPATKPGVRVALPKGFTASALPSGCTASTIFDGSTVVQCGLSRLAVAATRTVTFDVGAPASIGTGTVGQYTADAEWDSYPDSAPTNNYIERAIVV